MNEQALRVLLLILRIVVVGLALLGTILAGASGAPAHAATTLASFCQSTIDPKCQPGNIPILIDAGIVNIGVGATVATTATGVAGTVTTSAAGVAAGLGTAELVSGTTAITGGVYLTALAGLVIKTTETFFPPGSVVNLCNDATPTQCVIWLGVGHKVSDGTAVQCLYLEGPTTGTGLTFSSGAGSSTSTVSALKGNFTSGSVAPGACAAFPGANAIDNSASHTKLHWPSMAYTNFSDFGDGDPVAATGQVRATITCSTAPDASYELTATDSVTIDPGDPLPIPELTCDAGGILSGVTIEWKKTGDVDWTSVVNPLGVPDTLLEMVELYPECFGPDGSLCSVSLWRITDDDLASCGSHGQYCPDWAKSASPETKYECHYGSHEVELTMCSMFRDPKVGILPNYTTDPEDPDEWIPVPITAPTPTTIQQPLNPEGEPDPWPGGDPDADGGNCWAENGWGIFNPLSWVYVPMVCAAQLLFVPSEATQLGMITAVSTAWSGTSIAQGPEVIAPLAALPAFTGCDGVPVDIDFEWPISWGIHWRFGDACEGPLVAIAALTSTVLGIGVCLSALYLISSYLGGTISFRGFNNGGVDK